MYLFKLVHVLLYFFASIRGSSELVCPFFQHMGVNFSVLCLYCIDAARIQSGLQLWLQTLIFCFQVLVLSDEPSNFILFDINMTLSDLMINCWQRNRQFHYVKVFHFNNLRSNSKLSYHSTESLSMTAPQMVCVYNFVLISTRISTCLLLLWKHLKICRMLNLWPHTPVKAAPLWFFWDISSSRGCHCDHSHLYLL